MSCALTLAQNQMKHERYKELAGTLPSPLPPNFSTLSLITREPPHSLPTTTDETIEHVAKHVVGATDRDLQVLQSLEWHNFANEGEA